mgnify:CR=1 FL=1
MMNNDDLSQKLSKSEKPRGITAQNLTKQFENYGDLICTRHSNNFRDEQFEVFDSFYLDTDGQVFGDSVQLQGDSSLSFTVKDKSYVRLKITLKSTVPKSPYQNFKDFSIPPFEVLLEGGDSFSAGTRKIGMGWDYKDLSIVKRDGYVTAEDGGSIDIPTERMNAANGLDFLSTLNQMKLFNTINIKWLESWTCEEKPPETIPDDDEDSDFVPVVEEPETETETETETESEPLSDDTLWAILGIIILIGLCYYLFGGGGNDSVQEN